MDWNPKCEYRSFPGAVNFKASGNHLNGNSKCQRRKQTLIKHLLIIPSPPSLSAPLSLHSWLHFPATPHWESPSLIVLCPQFSPCENCIRDCSLCLSRWAQSNFVRGVSWTFLKFESHSYLDLNFEDLEVGSFHKRIKTHQRGTHWFGLATKAARITLLNSSRQCTLSPKKPLHTCLCRSQGCWREREDKSVQPISIAEKANQSMA